MADLYGTSFHQKIACRHSRRIMCCSAKSGSVVRTGYTLRWPREEVERFCKELGTDYLDICMIHCITDDKWAEDLKRVRDELAELKDQQIIRAHGVSCHDFAGLKLAAEDPRTDVIFAVSIIKAASSTRWMPQAEMAKS